MLPLTSKEELIFRVAVPIPIYRLFDYRVPQGINPVHFKPGIRVTVPFGGKKRLITAYLMEITQSDRDISSLKQIGEILDQEPLLDSDDLKLLLWASSYYHYPLGEVISAAFPVLLRKGKAATIKAAPCYQLTEAGESTDFEILKNAPKQAALLRKFHSQGSDLTASELKSWNKNWRHPLRELESKGLIKIAVRQTDVKKPVYLSTQNHDIIPNCEQSTAIQSVISNLEGFGTFLLEGVTGSGKTEVYLRIIDRVLQMGKQVLVLLPEINLTPQLEERFKERFQVPISIFHSGLTATERLHAWLNIQSGTSCILLGTRSALFTPLKSPGLIILDEEHDSSFKQQEGFRFSARDVAIFRAKNLNIPVLLGTATPSLESIHNVAKKRFQLLHLMERAGGATAPKLQILDIRNKKLDEGLSEPLVNAIKSRISRNEQVLIFLNRRGFAPTLMCHSCGWLAKCNRCDTNLVVHYKENLLRCHHCNKEIRRVDCCPDCQSTALTALGQGTERVEQALSRIFPNEDIIRLDRDTTQRKGELEKSLNTIREGNVRIILGTQMLAKGHHFPNVTLVGILDVDSGFFSIDYHTPEKMAQMIVQVAGRAGRAEKPGTVILQTRQPDHPLLNTLVKQGYKKFAETALADRKEANLPPFSYQALLRVSSLNKEAPVAFLEILASKLRPLNHGNSQILGPVPSPMPRRAGQYRFQMLFQNKNRTQLHALLDQLVKFIGTTKKSRQIRWSLDIDPSDLY